MRGLKAAGEPVTTRRVALGSAAAASVCAEAAAAARRASATGASPALAARRVVPELEPELAEALWTSVLETTTPPTSLAAEALAGRARARLAAGECAAAVRDAAAALEASGAAADASLVAFTLAAEGDWRGATGAWATAAGASGAADAAPLPPEPRGGAASVSQRAALGSALAAWELGGRAADAAAELRALIDQDPRYWDARAALAAASHAAGDDESAERAWAALCAPLGARRVGVGEGPPANRAVAAVSGLLWGAYDATLSSTCETLDGDVVELPCGASTAASLPCSLYTPREAERRAWPPVAVKALEAFLRADR